MRKPNPNTRYRFFKRRAKKLVDDKLATASNIADQLVLAYSEGVLDGAKLATMARVRP